METSTEVCEPLEGHTSLVTSVASSPDDVYIVSGSWDNSVRLWNIPDILAKCVINYNDSAKPAAPSPDSVVINSATSYPRREIATQYPPHLFPHPTFKIRDGWILGPNDEPLLWVPPANQSGLLNPTSRVMGLTHITELDFSNFKCGTEWMQCREPIETE